MDARSIKIHADATLIFPLLVAETFAKYVEAEKQKKEGKGEIRTMSLGGGK